MMGRNRNAGKPGAKNPGKTFKRIFAEIMSKYKVRWSRSLPQPETGFFAAYPQR